VNSSKQGQRVNYTEGSNAGGACSSTICSLFPAFPNIPSPEVFPQVRPPGTDRGFSRGGAPGTAPHRVFFLSKKYPVRPTGPPRPPGGLTCGFFEGV
jgi:hypothetical protein